MSQDPNCAVCNAGRPYLVGICTECGGCFGNHCDCFVCQHGQQRTEHCVFCGRDVGPLLDAVVLADDIESDLRWLMEPVDPNQE